MSKLLLFLVFSLQESVGIRPPHTLIHVYTHTHTQSHTVIASKYGNALPTVIHIRRILLHTLFTLQSRPNFTRNINHLPLTYDPGEMLLCVQEYSVPSEPAYATSCGLEVLVLHVSSHPVLSHKRDDAGWRTRLCQEGVFEDFAGHGPLSRVPHQHAVQKAFEQRRDLRRNERGRLTLGSLGKGVVLLNFIEL